MHSISLENVLRTTASHAEDKAAAKVAQKGNSVQFFWTLASLLA